MQKTDIRIIDTHAHIYPDKIAVKASKNIGDFYGIEMNLDGTVSSLKAEMRQFNVKRVVVCSVATAAAQVKRINDYLYEQSKDDFFIPLAAMHPDMDKCEIAEEAARVKELGFKGIKLHPDFQNFKICGEKARALFDALGDFNLPILVHTGDMRKDYSHPRYMVEAAADYPHLTFIAAHFGGWSEWGEAMRYKGLKNVMFDTSSTLAFIDKSMARNVIFSLGVEKFMFGTDYPMWNMADEIDNVLALDLGEDNNDKVFYKNAAKLFGIEE